ncbi:MAG: FG-GAP-like repeat-containing protein, partial [Candidatus Kapaibacteriota bacterium]
QYAVGTGPRALTSADFDGDGDLDIAASNFTSNNASILFNMPIPTVFYYQSGDAGLPGSWNSLPWGGGTPATAFSSPATDFIVMGGGGVTTASVIAPITIGANVSMHVTTPSVLVVGNFVTITNNGFLNVSGSTLQAARLQLVGSGAVTGNPVRYWSTNATLEYQTIAGTLTTSVELPSPMPGSVWVNGSNTVTLWGSTQINGAFTMQSGTFALGANTLTLNGAATFTGGSITGGVSSGLAITGTGNLNGAMTLSGGLQNLTMNRAGATLTLGAPLDVTNTLALTQGYIASSAANPLLVSNTLAGAVTGGGTASHVAGVLRRALPAGASVGTWLYPVGKGGTYLPFGIQDPTTTGGATVQAEAFNVGSGGSADGITLAGGSLSAAEYWAANVVSGSFTSGRMQIGRTGLTGTNLIGSSTVQTGLYASNGANTFNGVPVPPTLTRTLTDNLAAPTYFAAGIAANPAPSISAYAPVRNLNTAAPGSAVTLTWSLNVTAATASVGNMKVFGGMTGLLAGTYSQPALNQTQLQPTAAFKRGELISVTVTNAQASPSSVPSRPVVYQFRTAAGVGPGTFFQTNSPVAVGTTPQATVSGDFNGDGNLDLAVLNNGTTNVSILLGTGAFTFAAPVNYAVGTNPLGITAADLDNDGNLDIVVTNLGSNNVSVLQNSGSGTFAAAVNYAAGTGPRGVVCGDVDGDGDLDIITANWGTGSVYILLNNGGGIFAAPYNYISGGPSAMDLVCGDFDNDGDLDIATANGGGNNIGVLFNSGFGTFSGLTNYATGGNSHAISCGDFNGDGLLDLATSNSAGNNISVYLNAGSGTFPTRNDYAAQAMGGWSAITSGDFDGDGDIDLVSSNYGAGSISFFRNPG